MDESQVISEWEGRAVTIPETEPVTRGPREAFVETLRVNKALIRRKIKSPSLKIEDLRLGTVSDTDIILVYIKGIADEKLVAEVKNRLRKIKINAVLESGYIEELIEDNPWSPFPTVNHTERPDRVAAMLLEGRVAILVDGSPVALTVPNLFIEYLHTPDDYYERFLFATAARLIRFFSLIVSFILPSLYAAVLGFHHELLPTALLLSVTAQREILPFPLLLEIFVAELVLEILREAGNRLPRFTAQTVSIVGALVLGGIAVQAGLISATTVIVVVFAGIASLVIANSANLAFRLLRFVLLILSGTLGLIGLTSGVAIITIHMCTLRSFGIPYLSPLTPFIGSELGDTFIRAPWRAKNIKRVGGGSNAGER